jgi:SAM-dependent methyltransferase
MSKTIDDFGAQWSRYSENDGYYASSAMFADICGPLFDPAAIKGLRVADLGSGSGRIVRMLLELGAAHVTTVEPSDAMQALKRNTEEAMDRVTYIHDTGERLPDGPYDLIVSIGVIHHIPDPAPVVARAFQTLRPGGQFLVWIYGREGNELYLKIFEPLRTVTKRLPDFLLVGISHALTALLSVYIGLCRILPLPMRDYVLSVLGRYGWRHRFLTIFDQLNPAYAKYYRKDEAHALLVSVGFADVTLYHRHGYSWSVVGTKPA